MDSESLHLLTRRDALKRIGYFTGSALSASLVSGVLAGCRATPPDADFVPQSLDADQYKLVTTLSDIIIPATDTPGASGAGVPAFIDNMLTSWYLEEDKNTILTGLRILNEEAQRRYEMPFVDASPEQQHALVEQMAQQAFSASDANEEKGLPPELPALFREFKQLTVVGYYTSEVGASEELRIQPMGTYRGDIPYDEVGRAWS
ncbi:MAG: gluconate 2-dehydrogenase subunit 3 family protein [Rhodothermaceae bacterium]|nr:gluconate 2-dehydrogenase subunit 3 family protein [Rhodothermaceae bacterium]